MYNQVADIVRRIRPLVGSLSPSTRLVEDVGLDSLGLLEFGALIEDQFSVVLETRHMSSIRTLADACTLIRELSAHDTIEFSVETGAP